MKRIIAFIGMVVVMALAAPSSAEAQLRVGVGAGPAFPLGELGDEADMGLHVQGSLGLDVPLMPFGFRGDVLWQQYADEHGGDFTGLGGMVNGIWQLPMPAARPYVIGGIGVMSHEAPEEDHGDHAHEGESGSDFAFNVGAGVQLRLLGIGGFIEARYLDWGNGNRAVPLTLGFTF